MIAALALALFLQDPVPLPDREVVGPVEARSARDLAVRWLLDNQREDGGWASGVMDTLQEGVFSIESQYAWKVAADAIAILALASVDETPEIRAALDRAVERLCVQREPRRGNDWDTDYGWGALYAFQCAMELADDARFQSEEDQARIEDVARRYLAILLRIQSPQGGWAYYDDPIYSRRPKWDTSFCTALVLPGLRRALDRGWLEDEAVLARARKYVQRCKMPDGAYSYDWTPIPRINGGEHINRVKGSLARIQVCNWGLAMSGDERITDERIREGLEQFFEHHRFLDAARLRPIPHEAYYWNAGYFYMFGHYYAARAIQLLPAEERESWHARLRPHLLRAQREDGFALDFIDTTYERVACTGFLALGLSLGFTRMPPE